MRFYKNEHGVFSHCFIKYFDAFSPFLRLRLKSLFFPLFFVKIHAISPSSSLFHHFYNTSWNIYRLHQNHLTFCCFLGKWKEVLNILMGATTSLPPLFFRPKWSCFPSAFVSFSLFFQESLFFTPFLCYFCCLAWRPGKMIKKHLKNDQKRINRKTPLLF